MAVFVKMDIGCLKKMRGLIVKRLYLYRERFLYQPQFCGNRDDILKPLIIGPV